MPLIVSFDLIRCIAIFGEQANSRRYTTISNDNTENFFSIDVSTVNAHFVFTVYVYATSSGVVASEIIAASRLFQALCSPFALWQMDMISKTAKTKSLFFFFICNCVYSLVNVVHHFVVTAGCVDFCDDSWCQAIH